MRILSTKAWETKSNRAVRVSQRAFIIHDLLSSKTVVEVQRHCSDYARKDKEGELPPFQASASTIYALRKNVITELSAHGFQPGEVIPESLQEEIIRKFSGEKHIGRRTHEETREAIGIFISQNTGHMLSAKMIADGVGASEKYVSDYLRSDLKLSPDFPAPHTDYLYNDTDKPKFVLKNRSTTQYVFFTVQPIKLAVSEQTVTVLASRTKGLSLRFMPIGNGIKDMVTVIEKYISQYIACYDEEVPLPGRYTRFYVPVLCYFHLSEQDKKRIAERYYPVSNIHLLRRERRTV